LAGTADGEFGPETAAAVKAFQRDRGLEEDGIVGSATYLALMGRDIPVSRAGSPAAERPIVSTALRYRGVPYHFGGSTPRGFDCSGFTRYVFAKNGVDIPRQADEQFVRGQAVAAAHLQPGDLVFFGNSGPTNHHVGIYIGNGQMIHAPNSRTVVKISSIYYSGDLIQTVARY